MSVRSEVSPSRTMLRMWRLAQRLSHRLGRDGKLGEPMSRGVPHGIGDGRGRGDHGRLAHSLGTEGAVLRGYLDEHRAYRRHLLAPRHGVIHEGGREELALWIVAHALEKRPAEALGGRALES